MGLIGPYYPLLVLLNLYKSFFMRFYGSLWVFMGPHGSLLVLIGPDKFLWSLMCLFWVLIGPY